MAGQATRPKRCEASAESPEASENAEGDQEMANHGHCEICDTGLLVGESIEFHGDTEKGKRNGQPVYVATFTERTRCMHCGEWTILRRGTGYWSEEDWEAEGDAVLVYDADDSAD